MPYYLLKFHKKGKRAYGEAEKAMIQSEDLPRAKDKADEIAEGSGGGKAILQLFTEIGLVATRSEEGVWSR
jgi:hypothetical protein